MRGMLHVAKAVLAVLLLLVWTQTFTAATGVEIVQDRKVPFADRVAAATRYPEEGRRELREIMFGLPSLGMTSFAVQIADAVDLSNYREILRRRGLAD